MDQSPDRQAQVAKIREIYQKMNPRDQQIAQGMQALSLLPNMVMPQFIEEERAAEAFLKGENGAIDLSTWGEMIKAFLAQARQRIAFLEATTTVSNEGEGLNAILSQDGREIYVGNEDPEEIRSIMREHLKRGIELMQAAISE